MFSLSFTWSKSYNWPVWKLNLYENFKVDSPKNKHYRNPSAIFTDWTWERSDATFPLRVCVSFLCFFVPCFCILCKWRVVGVYMLHILHQLWSHWSINAPTLYCAGVNVQRQEGVALRWLEWQRISPSVLRPNRLQRTVCPASSWAKPGNPAIFSRGVTGTCFRNWMQNRCKWTIHYIPKRFFPSVSSFLSRKY
jgi:hypothetical protein